MPERGKDLKPVRRKKQPQGRVSLGRHEYACRICSHPRREEIESDFINWKSPISIAREYVLADRASVYRHAHALGLFAKRQRNIRAALERIIEKADEVEVSAAAVVSAIQAYAKINSEGQWIDRVQGVNLNELFDRMTGQELEVYAREGKLPDWFEATQVATGMDGQEENRNAQTHETKR